ncbi:UPF0280 family protein [Desulfatiferula olefinivorans]
MFDNRLVYQSRMNRAGLFAFSVRAGQTDLRIQARRDFTAEAVRQLLVYRGYLEAFIERCPAFATTLAPFPDPGPAPGIIRLMIEASRNAGVGPMASVAGALAEHVGRDLLALSDEVIVENGGDIFLQVGGPVTIGIYAGNSPLSMKIGIAFDRRNKPFSVCTSSGTVGHSLSFGAADAVCIVSDSALVADAAATSVGNRVRSARDIDDAVAFGRSIDGVRGILIVVGPTLGMWGDVELVRLGKKA